jgi:hypothetical protein
VKLELEENVEGVPKRRNTVAEQPRAEPVQELMWGQGIGNRARGFEAAQRWSQDSGEGELVCAVHSLDASSFRSTHCDHRMVQKHNLTAVVGQRSQQRRMGPPGLEECSEEGGERRDPGLAVAEEEVGHKLRTAV